MWLQWRVEEKGYKFVCRCLSVSVCVCIRYYTEQTWNQRVSHPAGCHYSGSERSQTPPLSLCRSRVCGKCWSGRHPPGSTRRAAARQSGGWSQEGWCHLKRREKLVFQTDSLYLCLAWYTVWKTVGWLIWLNWGQYGAHNAYNSIYCFFRTENTKYQIFPIFSFLNIIIYFSKTEYLFPCTLQVAEVEPELLHSMRWKTIIALEWTYFWRHSLKCRQKDCFFSRCLCLS